MIGSGSPDDDSEAVPITSLVCKWKCPSKWKESDLKISDNLISMYIDRRGKEKMRVQSTLIQVNSLFPFPFFLSLFFLSPLFLSPSFY